MHRECVPPHRINPCQVLESRTPRSTDVIDVLLRRASLTYRAPSAPMLFSCRAVEHHRYQCNAHSHSHTITPRHGMNHHTQSSTCVMNVLSQRASAITRASSSPSLLSYGSVSIACRARRTRAASSRSIDGPPTSALDVRSYCRVSATPTAPSRLVVVVVESP